MNLFNKILDLPIIEEYLGDYNENTFQMTLYDVPVKEVDKIVKVIKTITTKFKSVVGKEFEGRCNVKLLDIDL